MANDISAEWREIGLTALFRSPFLLPSLLLHAMLFLLAWQAATLSLVRPENDIPISVQLLEVRDGGSDNKSIGFAKGPGGPRTMPKLGLPVPPRERTGKLDSGSLESAVPSTANVEPAPTPKPPALPGPKLLASDAQRESVNVKETTPDSLVRLPTKEAAPTVLHGGAAADLEANQKSLGMVRGAADASGIKALKEGTQIPGALKGTGSGIGPYGVPGGSKSGTGLTGGGTGTGTGGGSNTGLKGIPAADFNQYLNQLKKRVESVWKYPEGVSGKQRVAVVFTLDRAGKLVRADVLESSDSRLNDSAVEAMRRASPFPPIPESLKELANEPLRMQFTVLIGVRG
ncbi:MAG TPA: TonB family protein [Candidatus Binatia bacterium]